MKIYIIKNKKNKVNKVKDLFLTTVILVSSIVIVDSLIDLFLENTDKEVDS